VPALLIERTRLRADPVRNFKYQVQLFHPNSNFNSQFAVIGFMTVEGIAMTTEMVPYREGGWNTNPHKLPGQSDFAPLTLSAGVFYDKPGMWNLAKMMFSVQWGSGTIGMGGEFRYDMAVRVLDHPVTQGPQSGAPRGADPSGSVIAFLFYNCWTASIGFNGLNAMDNAILIHQMTVHHEGFDVFFGNQDSQTLVHGGTSGSGPLTPLSGSF
jgi:phage tail-like protein